MGTLLSLFCLRRGVWGHSSRCFAFGGGVWGHSSRCFAFGGVCGDTPLAVLPSEGCVGTLLSLFCLRRGVWGHSSRCFAFGGVCGDTPLAVLPSEGCVGTLLSLFCLRRGVPMTNPAQIASRSFFQRGENDPHRDRFSNAGKTILTAIVFPKAGKTILDPSMRTVHSSPELNQVSPNSGIRGPDGLLDRRPAGTPGERPPLRV